MKKKPSLLRLESRARAIVWRGLLLSLLSLLSALALLFCAQSGQGEELRLLRFAASLADYALLFFAFGLVGGLLVQDFAHTYGNKT